MHSSAFFYFHVVSLRLHELAWRSNGSIKSQTLENVMIDILMDGRVLMYSVNKKSVFLKSYS